MTNCNNCDHQVDDKFCPKCGNLARLERIDSRYFSQQIQILFNVEKGFLYTIKELLIRPGSSIKEFLFEDRNKHVKPFVFLIFTSIIFTLITYFLNIEYSYLNVNRVIWLQDHVDTGALGEWLNNNIGYTNLIMGCFMALWIKVFFRKFDYNLFEILIMLCFVYGQATLILSLAIIVGNITDNGFVSIGAILLFFLYIIWAIGQFFGKKNLMNYIKSLLIFILGNISYLVIMSLMGYLFKSLQN